MLIFFTKDAIFVVINSFYVIITYDLGTNKCN